MDLQVHKLLLKQGTVMNILHLQCWFVWNDTDH